MNIQQAKKLKWGTVLKPSVSGRRQLKEYRHGIYLGLNRSKTSIKVVPRGSATPYSYAPVFWNVVAKETTNV